MLKSEVEHGRLLEIKALKVQSLDSKSISLRGIDVQVHTSIVEWRQKVFRSKFSNYVHHVTRVRVPTTAGGGGGGEGRAFFVISPSWEWSRASF